MTHRIYAIFDRATRRYSLPMTAETREAAVRQLRVASQSDPMLAKCAQDFSLALIGWYDTSTGVLSVQPEPEVYEIKDLLSDGGDNDEVQ